MFRASSRLLDCRLTLFTRANCSLCDTAKSVLENVKSKRPFTYQEINVMVLGQEKWRAVYEFDTPVVHADKSGVAETSTSALKLMHRFKEDEVMKLMDQAEKS
ncbi:hypothetical protein BCR34DRAFT_599826 [Clohesyomyces aquaticus]|uniref:Glutaredoxin-like protein n=1 Tax=Clohesyomyces aquaticus TaxID=1231657 RepID=A0A1Y1ZT82_9PLEO|nr:hypothetical protein BCR34DRAFT_599826 [Clohesyomyces aquaticus]